MNKVAWWRLALMALALAFGLLYSLPNLFGESPAVQVSTAKATLKVQPELAAQIEGLLATNQLAHTGVSWEASNTGNTVRARFGSTDLQLKAKDLIEKSLNGGSKPEDARYVVAPNLVSASPDWLSAIRALPMYLGLDLRGGVHFLLQVDLKTALTKRLDALQGETRTFLRDKRIRHSGIDRQADTVVVNFREESIRQAALPLLTEQFAELQWQPSECKTSPSNKTSAPWPTESTSWAWRSPSFSSKAPTES